ncbi:MAG: adenylyltransferase/cytidyltransferase family protein [Candidatus Nanohaloarchaea archaeon]
MAQGVFDVLHPGHLYYLRESRKLGDKLIVVIARDSRLDRELYFDESERRELVASLEMVDQALLGSEGDIYSTVEDVNPDVITLGYDQGHSPGEVKEMAESATGHEVRVERIGSEQDYSSSELKNQG